MPNGLPMLNNADLNPRSWPDREASNPRHLQPARIALPFVGVAILDEHLKYVSINPALANMNGVPLERHSGRHIRDILGSASRRVERALEKVLKTQRSLAGLTLREKLPGRHEVGIWIETLCPVRDAMGNVRGAAVLVAEIANPQLASNRHLGDGYFIGSSETSECLGLSEKDVSDQLRVIVKPRLTSHRASWRDLTGATVNLPCGHLGMGGGDLHLAELALMETVLSRRLRRG
jgi:hypothetical protein